MQTIRSGNPVLIRRPSSPSTTDYILDPNCHTVQNKISTWWQMCAYKQKPLISQWDRLVENRHVGNQLFKIWGKLALSWEWWWSRNYCLCSEARSSGDQFLKIAKNTSKIFAFVHTINIIRTRPLNIYVIYSNFLIQKHNNFWFFKFYKYLL